MVALTVRRQKRRVYLLCAAAAILCLLTPIYTYLLPPTLFGVLERQGPDDVPPEVVPDGEEDGDRREGMMLTHQFYHYDASKKYKVVPFAVVGSNWSAAGSAPLCLATQASVERMHSLAESLVSWGGPASVALFVPGPDAQILEIFLQRLLECSPDALQNASIHLVYPAERPPKDSSYAVAEGKQCESTPKRFVDELISSLRSPEVEKWREELLYPQNLLRNTAADRCPSEWVLTTDVDMITPPSLYRRLQNFLVRPWTKSCNKCSFVLPTYEVKQSNGSETGWGKVKEIPDTKEALLHLTNASLARAFHIAIFKENQKASQLPRWEKLASNKSNVISVAYDIKDFRFWYEPVYMARQGVPQFDERFVGFGMTRNTQAYEMFLAGYKFKILDNAFLIHWGFQNFKDRPSWRKNQTFNNYNFFKKWILEKSVAYDSDPGNLIKKISGDQSKRKVRVTLTNPQNKKANAMAKSGKLPIGQNKKLEVKPTKKAKS